MRFRILRIEGAVGGRGLARLVARGEYIAEIEMGVGEIRLGGNCFPEGGNGFLAIAELIFEKAEQVQHHRMAGAVAQQFPALCLRLVEAARLVQFERSRQMVGFDHDMVHRKGLTQITPKRCYHGKHAEESSKQI